MLLVYTSRINYPASPERFDVTAKGAYGKSPDPDAQVFAPTWRLVSWGKKMLRSAEERRARGEPAVELFEEWVWKLYRWRYEQRLRMSYREHRDAWERLLAREKVVLVCYCPNPKRCHRTILAQVLEKLGARFVGECDTEGEMIP